MQSRDQVGFTERSGVGVRNTVERQVELSPREKRRGEKRHKRKKGWPKHTPGGADVDEAVRRASGVVASSNRSHASTSNIVCRATRAAWRSRAGARPPAWCRLTPALPRPAI